MWDGRKKCSGRLSLSTVLSPSVASEPTTAAASGGYRERLVAFYSKYNPTKLSSVDQALACYEGEEDAMFAVRVAKYGPEPGTAA